MCKWSTLQKHQLSVVRSECIGRLLKRIRYLQPWRWNASGTETTWSWRDAESWLPHARFCSSCRSTSGSSRVAPEWFHYFTRSLQSLALCQRKAFHRPLAGAARLIWAWMNEAPSPSTNEVLVRSYFDIRLMNSSSSFHEVHYSFPNLNKLNNFRSWLFYHWLLMIAFSHTEFHSLNTLQYTWEKIWF